MGEIEPVMGAKPGSLGTVKGTIKGDKTVKRYDFKRPDRFSKDQLRMLEMMHEAFARHFGTALSASSARILGANDRIRTGHIGVGGQGKGNLGKFKSHAVAVCAGLGWDDLGNGACAHGCILGCVWAR